MNWFKKLIAGSEYARQHELLESYRSQIKDLDSKLKDFDKMKLRLTIYEECSGMKDGVEAAIEKITAQKLAGEHQRYFNQMAALQGMGAMSFSQQRLPQESLSYLIGGVLR